MIKVLFKSEDLLVAADTTKNTVIERLSSITPKNSEEAISIIMLIILLATSKYMIAKKISVTTKTEVVVKTAKSSVVKTAEDAIRIASKFGLKAEVQRELDNGATPLEALKEWDIL